MLLASLALPAGTATATAAAAFSEMPGKVSCRPAKAGGATCRLAWDLSATPRAYYRVERLSAAEAAWHGVSRTISADPRYEGVEVESEGLYRVMACNDPGFRDGCAASAAVWAVVIKPLDELPRQIDVIDADGVAETAEIIETMDEYGQLSQYNVYRMSNVVVKVGRRNPHLLPPMHPPEEPVGQPDLEHQILHNVYDQYMALREEMLEAATMRR